MTKIRVVLLILLVFSSIYNGKATTETSEEEATEHIEIDDDEEEESASIQVVQRDTLNTTTTSDSIDSPQEEENFTEVLSNTDTNTAEVKSDNLSEDLKNDSVTKLETQEDIEELRVTAHTSIEINEDLSNRQEQIEAGKVVKAVVENGAKTNERDEKNIENTSTVENDDNDWRSAEHDDSEIKNASEPADDESSAEQDSDEYIIDKKIDFELKSRMDVRAPEKRRQKFTTNPRYMEHHEDYGLLDSGPMRTFTEVVVPRYRPMLTRSGIIYTPTLLSMQSRSPLLDRLAGHWPSNRNHFRTEEVYPISRPRAISAPQYEETKMIDDYNDYGSNTYSYMPSRKVTTQRPPHQIPTPSKFDVFQKLVEASNHPKSQKRTLSEYHQRSYPESYG